MTESQLHARIEYCQTLQAKHKRLETYFRARMEEYREDLDRLSVQFLYGDPWEDDGTYMMS